MGEYTEQNHIEESTESIIEKELQPHIEMDQGGFSRKVFRRGDITFSFKGREETPVYEAATRAHTHLLGKAPRHVEKSEREAYITQFDTQNIPPEAKKHYIVNKSLLGVVELALKFGAPDQTLLDLEKELQEGKYNERALSLIDALVACNAVDDSGELLEKTNTNAEAIVLLSLLEDPHAKSIVQKRLDLFRQQEEKIKIESKKESRENTAKPFDPKELACVHATRYMPQVNEAGQYQIRSTSDATDNASFRNTIHFMLNCKVGDHGEGSWAEAGVVLISPFEKMMEKNGKPTVLNTVDTFWAQNPGTPITLPEETVIVLPGGSELRGLYEKKGNQIKFKSKDFNISDLRAVIEQQEDDKEKRKVIFEISDALSRMLIEYNLLMPVTDLQTICDIEEVRKKFLKAQERVGGPEGLSKYFLNERNDSLEESLKKLLKEEGLDGNILNAVVKHLGKGLQKVLFQLVNEAAVKYGIQEAGFENFSGALEASVTHRTDKLAEILGVGSIAHSGTLHRLLETTIYDRVAEASKDFFSRKDHPFDWKSFSMAPNGFTFLKLDPPTRRSLYESAYLTTREK